MTGTPEAPSRRTSILAALLILPIRFYQRFITPYTPATCRYYPTCSAYAVGSLRVHGAIKGTLLTAWRLLRCHPWSEGGIDRVPARGSWRGRQSFDYDDARRDGDSAPISAVRHRIVVVAENSNGEDDSAVENSAPYVDGAPSAGSTAA